MIITEKYMTVRREALSTEGHIPPSPIVLCYLLVMFYWSNHNYYYFLFVLLFWQHFFYEIKKSPVDSPFFILIHT